MSAAACAAQAQSVVVVQPNSHYFAGWTFTEIITPITSAVDIPIGGSNNNTTLAGRIMIVTNETPTASTGDIFHLSMNQNNIYGNPANLPANIDFNVPANAAYYGINRGQASFMFTQPLPEGAAFFIRDLDYDEAVDIHFVDCSGNPVDAGNFTFLQISDPALMTPPATTPPNYSIQGTAPARYWNLSAITSGNDPDSINGIVINSNQVCGVQISGTRPTSNGLVGYTFGMPWVNVNKSVASVNGSTAQTRVTQPQDTVNYAIKVSNPGSSAITLPAGFIQESLPAGVTFVSSADFTCTGLACTSSADVTVAAGGSVTLNITVKVDSALSRTATPSLTNTVAITGLNCAAAGNQCSVTTLTSPPGATAAAVPTNSPWSLALLAALLAAGGYAFRRTRSSTLH